MVDSARRFLLVHGQKNYKLIDCPPLPLPVQRPHPADHLRRCRQASHPDLAARFGNEFQAGLLDAKMTARHFGLARAACERHGRNPGTLVHSAATTVCCGATLAEAHRRAEIAKIDLDELSEIGIAATPAGLTEHLLAYREVGARPVLSSTARPEGPRADRADRGRGDAAPGLARPASSRPNSAARSSSLGLHEPARRCF